MDDNYISSLQPHAKGDLHDGIFFLKVILN